MAFGLVQSPNGTKFPWFGQQVKDWVLQKVDDRLHQTGDRIVSRAQQLAPVDTGALRNSISYIVAGEGLVRTLVIDVGMPYGIYQEYGTRNISPHPFIRPALLEIGRLWGIDVQMTFAHGGPTTWQGVYHTQGRYVVPSAIQPKPLTPKQRVHVENRLAPSGKAMHRGNVRRAKMRVRHAY